MAVACDPVVPVVRDSEKLCSTDDSFALRDASHGDEESLVALENAVFSVDRLSRRSFREFIDSPNARLRVTTVDGRIAAYALTIWRAGTGVARLYSIARDPAVSVKGLATELLRDAEAGAYRVGRAVMRLEVAVHNVRALALYRNAGYREIDEVAGYYEDGSDAFRMEKPLRGGEVPENPPEYYQQTTDFTCGAACLMMALRRGDPAFSFDPVTEVRLWREATTIFMTSGLGGCEPYGMASVLAEHGMPVEIWTTMDGPLLLRTVQNVEKRRVMTLAQADFQDRIRNRNVPVQIGFLPVVDLTEKLREGAFAILLISGSRMFGQQVPHWIVAWGADDDHVFIHDPWVEVKAFETPAAAASIPVPFAELNRMWKWGADRLRAAVIAWPQDASKAQR